MANSDNVVNVRLIAIPQLVTAMADKVTELLEGQGYEVIEQSRAYPMREPEEGKSRVYVTAIRKANVENQGLPALS